MLHNLYLRIFMTDKKYHNDNATKKNIIDRKILFLLFSLLYISKMVHLKN